MLPAGARVGIDPFCHTVDAVRSLSSKLQVRTAARPCARPLAALGSRDEPPTANSSDDDGMSRMLA